MGRIIPYIMENNPNVPNHQPVKNIHFIDSPVMVD
jgi:hypothetical protein